MSSVTPMILNATKVWEWQSCKRRAALSQEWRAVRWRTKALFDACLRRAVTLLSAGENPVNVAADARVRFLQAAASPGINVPYGNDPYLLAKDYCALIDVLVRSIARLTLLVLHDSPPVEVAPGMQWQVLAQADDSGTLHRWVTCDHWGNDDLMRELHGWFVAGDVMMTECPMVLHVMEIGQVRDGKLHSPWTRAYQHPTMPHLRVRFRKTNGKLPEGWTPVYLVDKPRSEIDKWVAQLWEDHAAEPHMRHITVKVPPAEVCQELRRQVHEEALGMERAAGTAWHLMPMSRGACDIMVPCPYQNICYSNQAAELVNIEKIGLYQRRERDKVIPRTEAPSRV